MPCAASFSRILNVFDIRRAANFGLAVQFNEGATWRRRLLTGQMPRQPQRERKGDTGINLPAQLTMAPQGKTEIASWMRFRLSISSIPIQLQLQLQFRELLQPCFCISAAVTEYHGLWPPSPPTIYLCSAPASAAARFLQLPRAKSHFRAIGLVRWLPKQSHIHTHKLIHTHARIEKHRHSHPHRNTHTQERSCAFTCTINLQQCNGQRPRPACRRLARRAHTHTHTQAHTCLQLWIHMQQCSRVRNCTQQQQSDALKSMLRSGVAAPTCTAGVMLIKTFGTIN